MSKQYEWDEAEGFAEFYERFFVPALFADWAKLTVEAGHVKPGDRVLDVACGTGVVAREARKITDAVYGLDLNTDMLRVAAEQDSSITWEQGDAQQILLRDNSFDVVFCQFALMFIPDKVRALKEMKRIGGRIVVTVWEELEKTPGYLEFVELLRDEFGTEAAAVLSSPFSLGEKQVLEAIFLEAGLKPTISTHETTARFPSMEAWITTDIRATPLSAMFDDDDLAKLIKIGKETLTEYENEDGSISFPAPAHIVTCRAYD